ncbi:MAG: tetratricopeptide repeat protein [Beutenbergiaceae bacterium]
MAELPVGGPWRQPRAAARNARAEADQLCARIDQTPEPQRRVLVDQALALAREAGDEQLEYRVRMHLTASARAAGDSDTMLGSFAWCLEQHDRDPRRFPAQSGTGDLMGQYRWVATTMSRSPAYPAEQIEALLAGMRQRYRRAGLGESGVLMARFECAWSQGRLREAERLRQQVIAAPRDSHSRCEACTYSQHAAFVAETGRQTEALSLLEHALASGTPCRHEPVRAISSSLLPLLRAGELAQAKAAHLRGYRLARESPEHVATLTDHLIFCAVTGNHARGLAMVERHLGWLAHPGLDVSSQLDAMRAIAVVLDSVDRTGRGEHPVPGSQAPQLAPFFGEPSAPLSVAELAQSAWRWADRTAAAFDARNGNGYQQARHRVARALLSEHYDLPVGYEAFAPAAPVLTEPVDGSGWLARAVESAAIGELTSAIDAAAAALRAELNAADRLEVLGRLTRWLLRHGETVEASAVLAERVRALSAAGRRMEAGLEQRLGLLLFSEDAAQVRQPLEAELDRVDGGEPVLRARVRSAVISHRLAQGDARGVQHLAHAHRADPAMRQFTDEWYHVTGLLASSMINQDPGPAKDLIDEALTLGWSRPEQAELLLLRAQAQAACDRLADAAADADAAAGLFAQVAGHAQAMYAGSQAGQYLERIDEHADALHRIRFAIGQAELAGADALPLRYHLGRVMVQAGRGAEAAELLRLVLQTETEREVPPEVRGITATWLGHAHRDGDTLDAALAAWQQAAELFERGADQLGAARSHRLSAQVLMQSDQLDDAEEQAARALELVRSADSEDLPLLVKSLHLLGNLELHSKGEAALDRLQQALELAQSHPDRDGFGWQTADITDSTARALQALERHQDAIATGLRGADLYAAAADPDSAAAAESLVATVMVGQNRHADAVPILQRAGHRAQDPELRSRVLLELSASLAALGHHAEAGRARAAAEQ